MFDIITDWFSDLDIEWDKVGWAFILWAACLLVLWKLMYQSYFIKPWIKIVLSIAMLPISYIILYFMSNR